MVSQEIHLYSMTEIAVECRSLFSFKQLVIALRRDMYRSLHHQNSHVSPFHTLTLDAWTEESHCFQTKIWLLKRRVSKPLPRIPRQNNSVVDSHFWWSEFVQVTFRLTLWCSLQRKKYLCLCVRLPFSPFEFPFYLRFLFNTLFLSTMNVSSPNRMNWMKQKRWIAVELLNYHPAFLYFPPFIEHLLFHFLIFLFLFLVTYPTALLTLCASVTETETNKGCFWDESPNLLFLGFCLPVSCQHEN